MASTDTTRLPVVRREVSNSRSTRRLRREGFVPGVVYGGGDEPVAFQVGARDLRLALAHAGAVLELSLDGEATTPVVLKDSYRDPVKGQILHVDMLRVRLDEAIQATVTLELTGVEDAPGVKEGGVLEHVTREVTVEALPTDIPDAITHDVSAMDINDTLVLSAVTPPPGVTILDDPEQTVATLTPPRLQDEEEAEVEAETELVGEEAEAAAEAERGGATGDEAVQQGEAAGE